MFFDYVTSNSARMYIAYEHFNSGAWPTGGGGRGKTVTVPSRPPTLIPGGALNFFFFFQVGVCGPDF